ncbi:MAG: HEAT repeat domain-containing protein [Chloroflexota bacterium]
MDFQTFFKDKSLKPKEKTEALSEHISNNPGQIARLVEFARAAKDPIKATCIEALEFVTQSKPGLVDRPTFDFIVESLGGKAPRVKWESAKVIGNAARNFPDKLEEAVAALLTNTEHDGTVVRWSAAYALGEIAKLKTPLNEELLPAIDAILAREEKNSIRKVYEKALKEIKKG